ncbi:MAG: hypothetical protein P8X39_10650 [Desulfofustis sp.]|jgi:hypothetical protein
MILNHKNLLIVAGTGRNVGKTEFICRLIKKFRSIADIYALKVSAVYPDEEMYHGSHADSELVGRLFEEFRTDLDKDTSRVLRAGAKRAFYLRSENDRIREGYLAFRNAIPEDAVVVCESNSLREVVEPGLMILIRSEAHVLKPRAAVLLPMCDFEITSDGQSGFYGLEDIELTTETGWGYRR